jgi:V/A-type H+-transporting ATPase subunit E
MEIQLQELIDKIKKDGIESASQEAARLKREAEGEVQRVLEAARKEAADIVARGKQEADRFEKAGIAAVEQASRNLILAFKAEIEALLAKIVLRESSAAYGEDTLKAALPDILKAWASKGGDKGIDVLLPESELNKLKSWFSSKLSAELKGGVELKSDRNLIAGFRLGEKDGSAYYDFSADSVEELLASYLNPRLAEILKTAAKGN